MYPDYYWCSRKFSGLIKDRLRRKDIQEETVFSRAERLLNEVLN